jgi:hypothetical protein
MAEPDATATRVWSPIMPALSSLDYASSGFSVPPAFAVEFVGLHEGSWRAAERDWERLVALVLDTREVGRHATGAEAVRQAVNAAAAFLTAKPEVWPWCPICRRRSDIPDSGGRQP